MIKSQHINFFFDNSKVKRELWKQTNAKRMTYERRYTMLFKTILNRHFKAVADRIDVTNYLNDKLPDMIITDSQVRLMMIDLYKNVGSSFAKDAYRKLKVVKTEAEDLEDAWLSEMENYAKTTATKKIISITGQSKEQAKKIIREVIKRSTDEGWGADVVAREIKKQLIQIGYELNTWRALRIARTEVMTASNTGAITGARSLNMPMVKYWIATYDTRTRDTHLNIENQNPIDIDEDFQVGDYRMEAPGDPRGGPEEIINCRCTVAFGVKGM
jgi:hypothetical protein